MSTLPLAEDFPFTRSPAAAEDVKGEELAREHPVVRGRLADGTEIWVALSHAAARQVLVDPRFSRAAALEPGAPQTAPSLVIPGMLTSMDGAEHARVRRLFAKALTPRRVEAMRPWIEELVSGLLDEMAAAPTPADLVERLSMPLPVKVICELLGVPYEDRDRFRRWTDATLAGTHDDVQAVFAAVGALQAYIGDLVEEKRKQPGDDLTSELTVVSEDGETLTRDQLVNNLFLLLVAGHETTLNQLSNGIVALLGEDREYDKLVERPELLPNAVEELLRHLMLTPAGTLIRIAVEDLELAGQPIKAGEGVVAMQHVANRDPAVFTDPDTLDLARTDVAAHLGFGAGPHFCAGAQLARLEMTVALGQLVRRFPRLRLAVPEDELSWKSGGLVRGPETLPVTW